MSLFHEKTFLKYFRRFFKIGNCFLGILEHSQNQKIITVPHASMKLQRGRGHTIFSRFY